MAANMSIRDWMKCNECDCTWYDDAENTFSGCPECGSDFEIFDSEE